MGAQTDGQMDRRTDGRTGGRADGRTDGRTDGPINPQSYTTKRTKCTPVDDCLGSSDANLREQTCEYSPDLELARDTHNHLDLKYLFRPPEMFRGMHKDHRNVSFRLPSWKLCGGLDKSYKMPPPGKYAVFLKCEN